MDLIEKLNWRYATKRMNGEKISRDKLDRVLEAIRLSASSLGFQPYTIYVIESEEWKNKISEKACTQPQVKESSHFLVFAGWKQAGEKEIEEYFQNISRTRNAPPEALADFRKAVTNTVVSKSPEEMFEWAAKQCYIALGFAMVSCAVEGIDATPMEGFIPSEMDKVLGLDTNKLSSAVCIALGKRNPETDYLVNAKKVRREKEKLFVQL